ncbi:hypothetical protein ACN26Y_04995 [Micromonospora sp. WMMD558]|uniref:hypothetical protein n=1 Tax=unclassified Micromonospora TaxID=2617518 RepID=UPI0012B455A9|nr:hypothetical protein [Micromonospora sp. WMMC415]QGN45691.1 hypothetical protein GKC29_01695 [Micromonospora sp. WMMC415]
MTEDRAQQPEEIRLDNPIPVPITPLVPTMHLDGVTMDNVNRADRPTALMPGANEAGARTEWDATSLEEAIRWLESHADFLHKQSYQMVEIQDRMGGNATAGMPTDTSPLGTFPRAQDLATKHSSLFTTTQQNVRNLAADLYQAANALREVKENYETAERANAMSAAEMERVFSDASKQKA